MTMKDAMEAASTDPAALERLYRSAQAEGDEAAFRETLQQCVATRPGDPLLEAWAHRLDLPLAQPDESHHDRRWFVIIGASVLMGFISALLAGGKAPIPVPDPQEGSVWFWVGWGPLVALGLLGYLAWAADTLKDRKRYALAAGAVVAVALYAGLTLGGRSDDPAILGALHLPFICWAIVGTALCLGYADPARQSFAFMVKSIETVLTGGIFLGAGLAFVGLTLGIFSVLGIEIPEDDLVVLLAWAFGAIPLLAVGSVYNTAAAPTAQDWHAGLTRTLRILTRLLLPLALGVLIVYVLWFIPAYFSKPFEERDVLIVYNVTILAIIVLLTVVVSGPIDARLGRRRSLFQYALLGLGALTLVLNAYALAAVVSRALEGGITPNRFAVIGWNVATLLILALVGVRLWKARQQPWIPVFRASMGLLTTLAALWAASLLLVLPLFNA